MQTTSILEILAMKATHSADGRWWFDGNRWRPAVSEDARQRFDGSHWRPNRRRWAGVTLVVAAVLLATWPVAMLVVFVERISVPLYPGQPPARWSVILEVLLPWWFGGALLLLIFSAVQWARRPVGRLTVADVPPSTGP